jgi:hypothetical protein
VNVNWTPKTIMFNLANAILSSGYQFDGVGL